LAPGLGNLIPTGRHVRLFADGKRLDVLRGLDVVPVPAVDGSGDPGLAR
jgi:hypothetical protein